MSEDPPSSNRGSLPPAGRGYAARIAWLLDDLIPVPGTRRRFGLDFLLGLVPGLGDLAGLILGLPILALALRRRLPLAVLLAMAFNVLVDAVVGVVPLAGNVFDFFWTSHRKNLELLESPEALGRVMREGWWALAGLTAVVALLAALLLAVLALLADWWMGQFAA